MAELGDDNFILLCWEAPGEFCHRQVVAAAAFLKLLELAHIGLEQMVQSEVSQGATSPPGEVQSELV
ncbi:MAG: hypothetical protein KKD99_02720 [Proteobacteria bacterium]|nr:hypothetical protein [Pseudomonadota bacterium]MBU4447475.1 hypothetical protein [Pseudomonadota bacterium]